MKRTIQQHIEQDRKEIADVNTNPQRKRHLRSELDSLERYHANHPETIADPSSLELYCDEHPDADECRIYNV